MSEEVKDVDVEARDLDLKLVVAGLSSRVNLENCDGFLNLENNRFKIINIQCGPVRYPAILTWNWVRQDQIWTYSYG